MRIIGMPKGVIRQRISRLRRSAWDRQTGASLPYVLVITLVVLLTGLAVTSRTFNGVFSSVFQQDSRRAREAAELGIKRIVAELNRERNRELLSVNPSDVIWDGAEVAANPNQCAALASPSRPSTADLARIRSGGIANAPSSLVYVADDGAVTADADGVLDANVAANIRYAYRLESVALAPDPGGPTPFTGSDANGLLNQRATLTMAVRGHSFNNGRSTGTVVVEERLEVLPKCCGRSLGVAFGNDLRPCRPINSSPGFGFLIGVGENTVGDAKLTGAKSELGVDLTPIDPVVCLGRPLDPDNPDDPTCPSSVTVGTDQVTVEVVPLPDNFPAVQTFPTALGVPAPGNLTGCDKSCTTSATSNGTFKRLNPSGETVIDITGVSDANLPTYCKSKSDDPAIGITTIHCNLSNLNINGIINVQTSTSRRLKLYFPNEGAAVSTGTGTSEFRHVNTTADATDGQITTQLQLFGCPEDITNGGCVGDASSTNTQTLILNGNSGTAFDPYFLYFPIGNLTLNGGGKAGDQFEGVLWVNSVRGNGGVEINVPGSGVEAILEETGVIDDEGTGNDRPLVWDFVTRAVRGFTLLPGS